jgi:hypothetical protein
MPASAVQARNCATQCRSPTIAIGRPFSGSETVCRDVLSYPGAVVLGDGSGCRRSDRDLSAFKLPVPVCARYFISVPVNSCCRSPNVFDLLMGMPSGLAVVTRFDPLDHI